MRILHLRLKNLNSLVGEWNIDFTHPDFESNGIFAIIGPTGAGKSTLLDAICLALYGKTPRLDKISKSSNEVMARQTGECFAEVTFETARGKYRCFWAQQRSHKKAGGELQSAKREIVDANTNEILESHLSRVETKIEEITGMDFQRFTRSMLLAQGGFDAFLKASPSERAPILEQITGTEIYSKISIGVFERTKSEAKKLENLERDFNSIELLSSEDEKSKMLEYEEKCQVSISLSAKYQSLGECKKWRIEVDRIAQELKAIDLKWNAFIAEEKLSQPDMEKLEHALKALNFEGDYRDLCHLKKQQDDDLKNHAGALLEKNALENALNEKMIACETAVKKYDESLNAQHQEFEVIKRVRELDNDQNIERKRTDGLLKRLSEEETTALSHKKSIEDSLKRTEKLRSHQKIIQTYFEEYICDESLVEKYSSIKENLDRFSEKKKLIEVKHSEYVFALEALQSNENQIKNNLCSYANAKASIEKKRELLKALSDDYEVICEKKDSLEWDEERKVIELQVTLFDLIKTAFEDFNKCELSQKNIRESIQHFQEKLKVFQRKEVDVQQQVEGLNKKSDELFRQQAIQRSIHSLEVERTRLCENQPCPLCGSLEHPFIHENMAEILSSNEIQLNQVNLEKKDVQIAFQDLAKKSSECETELRSLFKKQQEEATLAVQLNEKKEALFLRLNVIAENFQTIIDVDQHRNAAIEDFKIFEAKYKIYLEKGKNKNAAQKSYDKELLNYSKLEQQHRELAEVLSKSQSHFQYLKQDLDLRKNEYSELENYLLETLREFGFFTLGAVDPKQIKDDLFQRLTKWKKQEHAKRAVDEDIQKENVMQAELSGVQQHLEIALNVLKDEIKLSEERSAALLSKRLCIYGSKNPDREEELFKDRVESSRAILEEHKNEYIRLQHRVESLNTKIEELLKAIQERNQILQNKEQKFVSEISTIGFLDLESFKKASLMPEERVCLEKRKNLLEKQKEELLAEKKVAEKRSSELNQIPKTEKGLSVLEEEILQVTQELDNTKNRALILNLQLAENEKKKERAKVVHDKIVLQGKETEIWKGLCALIGAADGKKFRDFAQKMTLEMMIAQANRQLVKMSDRYLLRQSQNFPLELDVVDNYQAGEERSVKNLSGGEGFIVSLSLALGLSQMSSSKVRVDSLFLDEGFGTLDERALEMALDTLSELHQEGKVIGLISHVNVLKERISTQIKVQPISGGRSRIEGPGCSHV
ncbi:MAG: AAA family ATPase [Parachlamydiaceae bacterium]|nr:AAA family ATPase [Parachlamydiaceae bacterium]